MPKNALKCVRVSTNPREQIEIARKFAEKPGVITSFLDGQLPMLRCSLGEDTDVEFAVFGDVLSRVLQSHRVPMQRVANGMQTEALIELISGELDEDDPLKAAEKHQGLRTEIGRVLRELRHFRVDLQAYVDSFEDSSGRLRSLAQFEAKLSAYREQLGVVTTSDLAQQVLALEPTNVVLTRLLVFVGDELIPDYLAAVKKISELGVDVTVVAEQAGGLFEAGDLACDQLGAKQLGEAKPMWSTKIFTDDPLGVTPEIKLISAYDALAECEWALREVIQRRGEGILENRIVLSSVSEQDYAPILRSLAPSFGVHLSARSTAKLLDNTFARYLLELIRALAEPTPRLMVQLAKSSYFGLEPVQRDAFTDHVRESMKEPHLAWEHLLRWSESLVPESKFVRALLEWRVGAVAEHRTLAAWHGLLMDLTRQEGIADATTRSESPKATHDHYAYVALLRSLANYAFVVDRLRPEYYSLRQLVRACETIWNREDVSVPSSEHGVCYVSSAHEIGEADMVVLLGLTEGSLPRRRSENPILDDALREEIQRVTGIELLDSYFHARHQRSTFVRLISTASKHLVLCYPKTSDDRSFSPSSYVRRIETRLGEALIKVEPGIREIVPQLDECRIPRDLEIRMALDGPRVPIQEPRLTDPAVKERVRPNEQSGVGLRELALAAECPFHAVAQRHLRRGKTQVDPVMGYLRNLRQKSEFLRCATREEATEVLRNTADELLTSTITDLSEAEHALLETMIQKHLDGWVDQEFGMREVWPVEPSSVMTNISVENAPLLSSIPFGERKIPIRHTVPALSEMNSNKVITQFKKFKSDYLDPIKDVRNALELRYQFLLLCKNHDPAVVFDSVDGERTLVVLDTLPWRANRRSTKSLKTIAITDKDRVSFMKEVTLEARKGLNTLMHGDMAAIRGPYCQHCDFGDLCRTGQEILDPFEEPV